MARSNTPHRVEGTAPPGAPVGEKTWTLDGAIRDTSQIIERSWGGPGGEASLAVRDEFTVDADDAATYGIDLETHIPYWGRDEDHQYWKRENRTRGVMKAYPGAYVVKPDGGDKVTLGEDLCLMAIPRELWNKRERENAKARQHYESDLRPDVNNPDALYSKREFDIDEEGNPVEFENEAVREATLKQRMRAESEMNHAMGIVGDRSPTYGMSLMEATAFMEKRGINVEELQERSRQGATRAPMDHKTWSNMVAKSNSKQFAGFQGSGFANPQNSALEQAKRGQAKRDGK